MNNTTEIENLLSRLNTSLEQFTFPSLSDVEITPEDKLLLTKVKEVLETKIKQLSARQDKAQDAFDQMEEKLSSMQEFIEQLENAVNDVEEALSS